MSLKLRKPLGGRCITGGVCDSATQPAGNQDGEAVCAADVRAAPAAPTPPPTRDLLRQVPTVETRLHVSTDTPRLRSRKPGKHYAGKLSKGDNRRKL